MFVTGRYPRFTISFISVLFFYCIFFLVHSLNIQTGRAFDDQMNFHLPVIQHFLDGGSAQDYPAAVAPGFHLVLTYTAQLFSLDLFGMQLVNSLFLALLIGWIASDLYKRFNHFGGTFALVLPICVSIYTLPSAVWLLPDNITLLLSYAFIKMLMYVDGSKDARSIRDILLLAVLLVGIVCTRQNFIWLAALPLSLALYSFREGNQAKAVTFIFSVFPAVLTLASFIYFWEGLVPPSFQGIHQRFSFSAPAFFLTVLGCYSVFYFPLLAQTARHMAWQRIKLQCCFVVIAALMTSLAVATNYSFNEGRYSGLWNVAKLLPTISDRSTFIVLGSALGGTVLLLWGRCLTPKMRFVFGLSAAAFVLSLIANAYVFERYIAGVIYLFFIVALCSSKKEDIQITKVSIASLLLFFGVNCALLIRSFSVATLMN